MSDKLSSINYEVVIPGERFAFSTMRQMTGFARSLARRGYDVRCQVRNGAAAATFKREAWTPEEPR
jgi:hypothetical protein